MKDGRAHEDFLADEEAETDRCGTMTFRDALEGELAPKMEEGVTAAAGWAVPGPVLDPARLAAIGDELTDSESLRGAAAAGGNPRMLDWADMGGEGWKGDG